MPVAVFLIGYAIFAQGTSELMLAGLLPQIADDLGITIPQAGMLITGFAIGMLVGAPALAVLTLRWRRKHAMIAFLTIFAASHALGALTTSYELLLATRFVGAFVYAGFWAVGASSAMALVPENRRGRAMSVVAGGLTVATVIGLPAGAWIGQHLGWRGAFWAVAGLTVIAGIAVIAAVPESRSTDHPNVRTELHAFTNPRLWLAYAMTAVSTAALLGTFSYLAAMLIETTKLDPAWVPGVLFAYGLGALIGITIGGRSADTRPIGTMAAGFTGLLLLSMLLALTEEHIAAVVILVFLLGLVGFGTNPTLNSRVFVLAPTAPTLSVAGNVSAFNIGISVGPWLGGKALTAGLGYPSVSWIGAGLAGIAVVLLGFEAKAWLRQHGDQRIPSHQH